MEQQQRSLIFTAAVGLIILAIIVGSIYYLVKFIQGRVASNKNTPQASVQIAQDFAASPGSSVQVLQSSPVAQSSSSSQIPQTGNNAVSDKKVFNGGNFQMTYPKTWGLVKCSNSQNIELDPNNPADSTIVCDSATKPVTVIVGDAAGCEGDTAKVGTVDVTRAQETLNGDVYHQWCTKTTPVLKISHRVSQQNKKAFSAQDFSKQIEEMIANVSFTHGT